MSVKISELPLLSTLADGDVLAGVDTSENTTSKIQLSTLKDYIDTNTTYTAGTNIDITNNVISAPNVYNKDEMDSQIEELQNEVDSLSNIYNAFPTVSGEGESVSLDGTAEVKFKSLDLKGNTSQNGTPTPSTPINVNVVSGDNQLKIYGNNLFDEKNFIDGGLTLSDGYYTGAINTIRAYMNSKPNLIAFEENTRYTISFKGYNGTATSCRVRVVYTDGNYSESSNLSSTETTISITSNEGKTIDYITFNYGNAGTFFIKNFMLNKGTSQETYEPYNGTTYNVNLPIENLITNTEYGLAIGSGGAITNNINRKAYYCEAKPNTKYYISRSDVGTSTYWYYAFTDTIPVGGITALSYGDMGSNTLYSSATSPANTKYITIFMGGGLSDDVMVSTNSSHVYTPYGTTPIELCKIGDYTDYFLHDKTLDKWYLHKATRKMTFVGGNESWNEETNFYQSQNIIQRGKDTDLALTNYFARSTSGGFIMTSLYLRIYDKTTFPTLTDLKTWLGTHNVNLYYALDTPTNTEITYQPLIDQLNAIEKAMSKDGQTNISQVNNDKPFIIKAEAIASLQNVLDRVTLLES